MQRRSAAAVVVGAVLPVAGAVAVAIGPVQAAAASTTIKVTPHSGLVNGQTVTVSGRGLVHTYRGAPQTWFATQCTGSVRGRMNPDTYTPHCNLTDAKVIRVARNGTFSTRYRVVAGIVGDGYCGTAGHLSCVIVVGTAQGLGTDVRVTFKSPVSESTPSSTTTTH